MDRRSLFLVVLALAACATPASRIKKHRDVFDAAPPEVQEKIRKGQIDVGFSQDEVILALGRPERVYSAKTQGAEDREVWIYGDGRPRTGVGLGLGVFGGGPVSTGVEIGSTVPVDDTPSKRVTFQGGQVVSIEQAR